MDSFLEIDDKIGKVNDNSQSASVKVKKVRNCTVISGSLANKKDGYVNGSTILEPIPVATVLQSPEGTKSQSIGAPLETPQATKAVPNRQSPLAPVNTPQTLASQTKCQLLSLTVDPSSSVFTNNLTTPNTNIDIKKVTTLASTTLTQTPPVTTIASLNIPETSLTEANLRPRIIQNQPTTFGSKMTLIIKNSVPTPVTISQEPLFTPASQTSTIATSKTITTTALSESMSASSIASKPIDTPALSSTITEQPSTTSTTQSLDSSKLSSRSTQALEGMAVQSTAQDGNKKDFEAVANSPVMETIDVRKTETKKAIKRKKISRLTVKKSHKSKIEEWYCGTCKKNGRINSALCSECARYSHVQCSTEEPPGVWTCNGCRNQE